jgi:hypothetical protein
MCRQAADIGKDIWPPMDEEICIFHSPWRSSLRFATGLLSKSELATSFAQDWMRSSSSSLWYLQLRGGEPDAAATDDVSDASEVDS